MTRTKLLIFYICITSASLIQCLGFRFLVFLIWIEFTNKFQYRDALPSWNMRSHVTRLCIWARKSQMRVFLSVSWESNLAMFKPFTESANYILASTMYYCCSVTKSCPTLCDFMNCSTPGFSVLISQSLLRLMSIALVMPSSHLILCHPLLLLPSLFPRIRVLFCFFFPNE